MHFAFPPRKTSNPPPYARNQRSSSFRRKRLKLGAVLACAALTFLLLALRFFSGSAEKIPAGTPEVVVVTVLDSDMGRQYVDRIKENRQYYANQHGMFGISKSLSVYLRR